MSTMETVVLQYQTIRWFNFFYLLEILWPLFMIAKKTFQKT